MKIQHFSALAAALALFCAPIASAQPQHATQLTQQQREGALIIDGVSLIGPPPAPGSVREAADRLAMRPQTSPERLRQAVIDEEVSVWAAYHVVLGDNFTAARLPRTAALIDLVNAAIGPEIGAAKGHWTRPRPFIADPSVLQCSPPSDSLRAQSSYPSGHSTLGYSWALVLAEALPSRASEILLRGREYGDSRVICGFHFQSDIDAGRVLASGTVAALHGDAHFRRALDAARRELARAYPAN